MRFIINIHLASNKKSTYKIDAKDEDEAKQRLMLRINPKDRDSMIIDSITIDSSTIVDNDTYGTFNED